jgi:tetratricopeptide (TPR) repeat protein
MIGLLPLHFFFREGATKMHGGGHETLKGLRRLFAGQGAPAEAERAAAHLTSCRECWLLASRAIAAQKAEGELVLQGPLRSVLHLHQVEQSRLQEWLEARATWAELKHLGKKARRDKVRLTRSLHTLGFLEALLEEGAAAGAPAESEEVFYLALLVAGQLPSSDFSVEVKSGLCAECCAEIANARRRQAKWAAARDAVKKGNEYLQRGAGEGVVEGKLLCVAGALEDDLGNTEEAEKLLRAAITLFKAAADSFLESRTLVQLAYILVDIKPAESLRLVEQALSLIPERNPRLVMLAEGIKVDCLIALGLVPEALLRFKALKDLHDQFHEPFVQLRRQFNAARILEHLGRFQRAESLFQEVIAGDLEHGLLRDCFLDLAYLFGFYLRRNQPQEAIAVCRRAAQELSLLDDEDRSGRAARDQMQEVWRGLEEEVRRGGVQLGAPDVLRRYIKAHWKFPASELPFLPRKS